MAQFGWAYINCSSSGGTANHAGPLNSIQYLVSSTDTSGSSNLTFDVSSSLLNLNGDLNVNGSITASVFVTDRTDLISGSTIFGNTTDDTHQFTGSIYVGPSASAPTFYVDVFNSQSVTTGFRVAYMSVTASGVTSSNSNYIIGLGGSGDLEFRIHSASVAGSGALLIVKDEISPRVGSITLSASSGDTIDGNAFYEISGSNPAISLYSNGTNWFVF
jgi:hypothetical protein